MAPPHVERYPDRKVDGNMINIARRACHLWYILVILIMLLMAIFCFSSAVVTEYTTGVMVGGLPANYFAPRVSIIPTWMNGGAIVSVRSREPLTIRPPRVNLTDFIRFRNIRWRGY